MLLINPLSANSQTTSLEELNDTICYELKDAKVLLKYAERGYICDSLIIEYDNQIKNLSEIIQTKDEQLVLCEQASNQLRNEIEKTHREKKFWMGATVVSTLTAVFFILF